MPYTERPHPYLPAGLPLEVPLDEEEPEPDDDPDELELRPRRIGGVFACDQRGQCALTLLQARTSCEHEWAHS